MPRTRSPSVPVPVADPPKTHRAAATAPRSGMRQFVKHHFRHFNAAAVADAAEAYCRTLDRGDKMLLTLAGAMSTAELGLSLAEMIRRDKVHAISCTGANLEEDLFNLVAHDEYERIPHYRSLSPEDEVKLRERGMNRVTDTCIPEEQAIRRIEGAILKRWKDADRAGRRHLPHEYFYAILKDGDLKDKYQIDPAASWLYAAAQRNLPIFVPGWEDSTLGNILAARILEGQIQRPEIVRGGVEYMVELGRWYEATTGTGESAGGIGFFQIGGGIAGDFPICVVPMFRQDLKRDVPVWSYFCQIGDSTTSYGSYSGATPSEKITWGKLAAGTPKFMIESDATIVAPLIFGYVLDW